jgi:hypothetical protein
VGIRARENDLALGSRVDNTAEGTSYEVFLLQSVDCARVNVV